MKFTLPAADLKAAIKKIAIAVPSRPGSPVLGTIHAALSPGGLTLTTTDLHITIAYSIITATVEGEGVMLIPFNEVKNLLALLSDEISIYDQDGSIMLNCGLDIFCLGKGMEPKDFPKLPRIAEGRVFPIEEKILSFINVAAMGVSADENKPAFMHVLLELAKDSANVVSCDVNSLYIKNIKAETGIEEPENLLIPVTVAKIIETMAIPSVGYNKNHCLFSTPDLKVYFKRTDAIYPQYKAIIPVHDSNVNVSAVKLDAAMAKALVVNADVNFNGIDLNINPDSIEVVSEGTTTGMSARCFIDATSVNCPVPSVRINGRIFKRLLVQAQAHSEVENKLNISLHAPNKAISIKIAGDDSLTMIVMPIAKTK